MGPQSSIDGPDAEDGITRFVHFLTELRSSGYSIGLDKVIAAHALLLTLKVRGLLPADRSRLKTLIAPVICTSASMQQEFYSRFDEWLAGELPPERAQPVDPAGIEPILESAKARVVTARARVLIGMIASILFMALAFCWTTIVAEKEAPLPVRTEPKNLTAAKDGVKMVNLGPTRSAGYITQALLRLVAPYLAGATILIILIVWRWRLIWRGQARIILDRQPGLKHSIPARLRRGRSRASLFARVRRSPWALRYLRSQPVGRQDLDIAATLRSSIKNGGLLTPINHSREVRPEYLVLVERMTSRDHQSAWCDALLDRLEEMGVRIVRYNFAGDPRWCTPARGGTQGLTLAELQARHPDHRLLLFGDCRALANPMTGTLAPWASQLLSWPEHAILTPEPRSGWGAHERMLMSCQFVVSPAGPDGLAQLIDKIDGRRKQAPRKSQPAVALPDALRLLAFRWMGTEAPSDGEIRALLIDLHWYLGVEGYDLFCACAVYPELDWNITLYMARLNITGEPGTEEAVLAKLSRLPWFRHGRMPDWLRLELLDELGPEREQAAREALQKLLLGQTNAHDVRFDLPLAAGNRETVEAIARDVLDELARQEVPSGPLWDPIFVSFMGGRRVRRLAVTLPGRRRSRDRDALRSLATPDPARKPVDTGLGPTLGQRDQARVGRPWWVYAIVAIYTLLVTLIYGWSFWLIKTIADPVWFFLTVTLAIMAAQAGLLYVPVQFARRRPVRRRSLWPTLIGSGAFAAILVLGLGLIAYAVTITDEKRADDHLVYMLFAFLIAATLTWIFWCILFYLASFSREPTTVGSWLHERLIRGSILELLIAVVAHIIVRRKGMCSAGLYSFFGICCGLAVTIVAFGPSVVILFAGRARSISPKPVPERPVASRSPSSWNRFSRPPFRRIVLSLVVVLVALIIWDLFFPITLEGRQGSSFISDLWSFLRHGDFVPFFQGSRPLEAK
jgi:hypothetical protein